MILRTVTFPVPVKNLFCGLLVLYLFGSISCLEQTLIDTDAATRAKVTLNGLFHYFWKNDPNSKEIQFFFTCGQIGGCGNQPNSQCSCDHPNSCTNCYRWWDAIAMESVASYGIYMNTRNNSNMADSIVAHSPYNEKFNGSSICTYVDDFVWYASAYLRFYEWLGVRKCYLVLHLLA